MQKPSKTNDHSCIQLLGNNTNFVMATLTKHEIMRGLDSEHLLNIRTDHVLNISNDIIGLTICTRTRPSGDQTSFQIKLYCNYHQYFGVVRRGTYVYRVRT